MDEGHYFNDPERLRLGAIDHRARSAHPARRVVGDRRPSRAVLPVGRGSRAACDSQLVDSREQGPLVHEYREDMLIETVKDLAHSGDVPAIVFVFGREQCFEVARLLEVVPALHDG